MAKVLVIFSHPAFQKSKVNKALLNALAGFDQIKIHDLYECYPDFHIDVAREQALLLEYDRIVLQHPFYWYSMPALLKEWLDLVLSFGFAYGKNGDKLNGKWLMSTITAGGSEATYQMSGQKELTRDKLLFVFTKLAGLCQMNYLPPFTVVGTHALNQHDLEKISVDYLQLLKQLSEETIELEKVMSFVTMNDYLKKSEKR